jgi:peptidoglycan/xylan/chitin deacetylase (PgdA/CDA1 family)
VISLDFELAWGMLGVVDVDGPWRRVALRTREMVPRLLDRFAAHGVAATWATVGLLFAESREEARAYAPTVRPAYRAPIVDPYAAPCGADERHDPIRYAPSLLRTIATCPRQEIGSHAYGHFAALEPGHDREAFAADVAAAVRIAAARDVTLRSWVWPRHQVRPEWLPDLAGAGFVAHRGPPVHRWYAPAPGRQGGPAVRAGRLLDAYLPLTGPGAHAWTALHRRHGVTNVPESRFLRPPGRVLEALRVRRVVRALRHAAVHGQVLHVWWHPHNLAVDPDAGLAAVGALLDAYDEARDAFGMASLTMAEAAAVAATVAPVGPEPSARSGRPASSSA